MSTSWQWIIFNSAGIQAIAAAIAAAFAVAGFAVLCVYALDTKIIARVAANQTRDSVIPFIALDLAPDETDITGLSWKIYNQGLGPALNVKIWLRDDNNTKERFSIMRGDYHKLFGKSSVENEHIIARLNTETGIRMEYESLAGEKFRSIFTHTGADGGPRSVKVVFENLSRPATSA